MARMPLVLFWPLFSASSERKVRDVPNLLLRATNRREVESRSSGLESSEARQKFAGAKAISSDMFFGREVDAEVSGVVYPEAGSSAQKQELSPCLCFGI